MAQGKIGYISSGQTTSAGKPKWGVKLEGDETWYNTTNGAFAEAYAVGDSVTLDSSEFHGSQWFNKFSGVGTATAEVATPAVNGYSAPRSATTQSSRTPKDRWIFVQTLLKAWVSPTDSFQQVEEKAEASWKLSGTVGKANAVDQTPSAGISETASPAAPDLSINGEELSAPVPAAPTAEFNDDIPF